MRNRYKYVIIMWKSQKGENMYNKLRNIAEYFNIPERTLYDWKKKEEEYYSSPEPKRDWRPVLLDRLDDYKMLEEDAVKKVLDLLNKEEIQKLIFAVTASDDVLMYKEFKVTDFKKLLENAILYSDLEDKEKDVLLYKLKDLCNFEAYAIIKAILEKAYWEEEDNAGYSVDKLIAAYS